MELQLVFIFILSILTVVIVAVGIYLVLVLKDFRQTLQKANLILDDVEDITEVVSHPLNIFTGLLQGYKAIKNLRKDE